MDRCRGVKMRRGFFDAAPRAREPAPRAREPAPRTPDRRCAPRDDDYESFAKFFGFPAWTPGEPCEQFENILVLLHGDLDDPMNFHKFGRMLHLPMTGLWSLGGVLDARGRAGATEEETHRRWMLSAEEGASEDARARQLDAASSAVQRALRALRDRRGWDLSRVHLFGFSDGGAVALDVATRMTGRERLGSCAVVAAALPRPESYEQCDEAPTPVLLIAGTRDEVTPLARVRETAAALVRRNHECGAVVREFDKTHKMISTADEAKALMEFLSRRLTFFGSRASDYGDDVVEISAGATERQ
jgi:predicted esterase